MAQQDDFRFPALTFVARSGLTVLSREWATCCPTSVFTTDAGNGYLQSAFGGAHLRRLRTVPKIVRNLVYPRNWRANEFPALPFHPSGAVLFFGGFLTRLPHQSWASCSLAWAGPDTVLGGKQAAAAMNLLAIVAAVARLDLVPFELVPPVSELQRTCLVLRPLI